MHSTTRSQILVITKAAATMNSSVQLQGARKGSAVFLTRRMQSPRVTCGSTLRSVGVKRLLSLLTKQRILKRHIPLSLGQKTAPSQHLSNALGKARSHIRIGNTQEQKQSTYSCCGCADVEVDGEATEQRLYAGWLKACDHSRSLNIAAFSH